MITLINPPAQIIIVRDMMGGLGFGADELLPPLDLAYLAATLREEGYDVKLIDSDALGLNVEDVLKVVDRINPEVIISNISLPTLESDCLLLKKLKENTSAKIIAKTGITYPPILEEILKKSQAEFCIFGECDLTIHKIISGENTDGVALLQNDNLVLNDIKYLSDLDQLPIPARDLLPNEKYHYCLLGENVTTMQTSSGCPFPCSYYCPYPLVQGKKWRARSPEHVYKELENVVNVHNIKKVLFRDAVFTLSIKRTEKICDLIIQKDLKFEWWCETRVDRLNEDLLKKMKEAGCKGMNVGIETGDSRVMETQAKVGLTSEKLKKFVKVAKEIDLKLHYLLMLGLPEENKKSLYETFKLVQKLEPDSIGTTIVTPYPGTPLFEDAKEKEWIETFEWDKYDGHIPVMHTDNLSIKDMLFAQKMIYRGFYLSQGNSAIKKLILKAIDLYFNMWTHT